MMGDEDIWAEQDIDEAEASVSVMPLSDEQRKGAYEDLDNRRQALRLEQRDKNFQVSQRMIEAGKAALRECAPAGQLPFDREHIVAKIFKAMIRAR